MSRRAAINTGLSVVGVALLIWQVQDAGGVAAVRRGLASVGAGFVAVLDPVIPSLSHARDRVARAPRRAGAGVGGAGGDDQRRRARQHHTVRSGSERTGEGVLPRPPSRSAARVRRARGRKLLLQRVGGGVRDRRCRGDARRVRRAADRVATGWHRRARADGGRSCGRWLDRVAQAGDGERRAAAPAVDSRPACSRIGCAISRG